MLRKLSFLTQILLARPERVLEGRYLLQRYIPTGTAAEIWQATDGRLDRTVAIKRLALYPGGDNQDLVQRFQREAAAMQKVRSPEIVEIYESGLDRWKRPYIVMEWVAGGSLKDALRVRGRYEVEEALPLFLQIARGVAAIHRAGLIHRDLKPGNLLMAEGGVKVADFGIALDVSTPRQTQQGIVIGTPTYMAPEQIRGGAITPASDIYALGVVFFEMLTGVPPFEGDIDTVRQRHLTSEPPDLRASVGGRLGVLPDLVNGMLAKEALQRWPQTGMDLERMLSDQVQTTRQMVIQPDSRSRETVLTAPVTHVSSPGYGPPPPPVRDDITSTVGARLSNVGAALRWMWLVVTSGVGKGVATWRRGAMGTTRSLHSRSVLLRRVENGARGMLEGIATGALAGVIGALVPALVLLAIRLALDPAVAGWVWGYIVSGAPPPTISEAFASESSRLAGLYGRQMGGMGAISGALLGMVLGGWMGITHRMMPGGIGTRVLRALGGGLKGMMIGPIAATLLWTLFLLFEVVQDVALNEPVLAELPDLVRMGLPLTAFWTTVGMVGWAFFRAVNAAVGAGATQKHRSVIVHAALSALRGAVCIIAGVTILGSLLPLEESTAVALNQLLSPHGLLNRIPVSGPALVGLVGGAFFGLLTPDRRDPAPLPQMPVQKRVT